MPPNSLPMAAFLGVDDDVAMGKTKCQKQDALLLAYLRSEVEVENKRSALSVSGHRKT